MNDMEENLDLLDLDEDTGLDSLPEASPFTTPRPKKPWLLLGVGLLVIILATYIIIRTIGSDSSSSIDVDLDAPNVVMVDPSADVLAPAPVDTVAVPVAVVTVPATPTVAPVVVAQPAAVVQPAQVVQETTGVPERVVADRKEVTFKPNKTTSAKPAVVPAAKIKPAVKTKAAAISSWYVQFGSYSTRALAEAAQKKVQASHTGLFSGKQFVILAAVLPNGTTTYRLRIGFATSGEANGFCRNAKSDGVDCYVAK